MLIYMTVIMVVGSLHLAQSRVINNNNNNNNMDNDVSQTPRRLYLDYWLVIEPMKHTVVNRNVGDHVELECEARGSPPPVIQWYKNDMKLTVNDNFETNMIPTGTYAIAKVKSRLVLPYILPRHHGVYKCVAQGALEKSQDVKLNVVNREGREMNFTQLMAAKILGAYHKPRITFWSIFYMDDMGKDVVLPCMSVGNPLPKKTWIKHDKVADMQPIEEDGHYKILPDGSLRITNLQWEDMGTYSCMIDNEVGMDGVDTFVYPFLPSEN